MNLYLLNKQINAIASNEKRTCSEQVRMCSLLQDVEALQCDITYDRANQSYLIQRNSVSATEMAPAEYDISELYKIFRKKLGKCKTVEDVVLFIKTVSDSDLLDYEKEQLKYLANDIYLGISEERG